MAVKVLGAKELARKLKRIDDDLRKKVLRTATRNGANVVRDAAIAKAPTGPTGRLKANIITRVDNKEATRYSSVYRVGVNKRIWYFPFVEFGTSKMSAQPFLRPAFEANTGEAQAKMRAVLSRRLKKV